MNLVIFNYLFADSSLGKIIFMVIVIDKWTLCFGVANIASLFNS